MEKQHQESDTFEDGLYLIDFGFATECECDNGVLYVQTPFCGTVRYASPQVLQQLQSGEQDVRYTELDEWHSVIRVLYGLSNTKMHQHLTGLPSTAYDEVQKCWDAALLGPWNCDKLNTPDSLYQKARELAEFVFLDFEYRM